MPNTNKILDCKEKIRIQFLGAVGNVTGSRTLLETFWSRFYIDAGLYQGPKYIEKKNYTPLETQVSSIDAIFLTHAHIDHSGLLPRLVKEGFQGKIYCTPSTADLLKVVLPDAGRLMEEEFKKLNRRRSANLKLESPLFTEKDAWETIKFIESIPFNKVYKVKDVQVCYYWAGHILGAAHLWLQHRSISFLFSGDIGHSKPIFHREKNSSLPGSNYVVVESTYASYYREKENYSRKMINAVESILKNKGMLIMPAFAIGRAQLILYVLFRLIAKEEIPNIPIYLDSPMAVKATYCYMKYSEELREEVKEEGYFTFLKSSTVKLIESARESINLNSLKGAGIIVTASGMCHGGRVLHHLYNRIWSKENYILFTGYQAEGTLGRVLLEGLKKVTIFGKEFTVRAKVDSLSAFSAHADSDELIRWIRSLEPNALKTLFINHGDENSREALKKRLNFLNGTKIRLPKSQQIYYIPI